MAGISGFLKATFAPELSPLIIIMAGASTMGVAKLIHASMGEDLKWSDRASEPYMYDSMDKPHHRKVRVRMALPTTSWRLRALCLIAFPPAPPRP